MEALLVDHLMKIICRKGHNANGKSLCKILKVKNLRSSILYLYPSTKQLILLLFPDGVINGLST